MKDHIKIESIPKYLLLPLICMFIVRCSNTPGGYKSDHYEIKPVYKDYNQKNEELAVSPPPFTDGIFPCNDCHTDLKPNPVRRNLVDMHDDIAAMFNHDSQNRWCLDCHDLNNRDSLRLASGKLLDFKESYKLCGQCHGDKLRDWKVGVHGKRIGEWNGQKQYFLCVSCHNPHSPKFAKLKPDPPPNKQFEVNK